MAKKKRTPAPLITPIMRRRFVRWLLALTWSEPPILTIPAYPDERDFRSHIQARCLAEGPNTQPEENL
jgi:hypothetical protein